MLAFFVCVLLSRRCVFAVMILRPFLISIASLLSRVSANDLVNGTQFTDDAEGVAQVAAPLFHFGRPHGYKTCYPSSVYNSDGTQVHAASQDNGIWWNIAKGCGDPGEWKGANTPGAKDMPTYYTMNYCPLDDTWRVMYNLYWRHVRIS